MLFRKNGIFKALSGLAVFSFLGTNFLQAKNYPSTSVSFVKEQYSSEKLKNFKKENNLWNSSMWEEVRKKATSPLVLPSLITLPPTLLTLAYYYSRDKGKTLFSDVSNKDSEIENVQTKEKNGSRVTSKNSENSKKAEISDKTTLKKDTEESIKKENDLPNSINNGRKYENIKKNTGTSEEEIKKGSKNITEKEIILPNYTPRNHKNGPSYNKTTKKYEEEDYSLIFALFFVALMCFGIYYIFNRPKESRLKGRFDNQNIIFKGEGKELFNLNTTDEITDKQLKDIASGNIKNIYSYNEDGVHIPGFGFVSNEELTKQQEALDSIKSGMSKEEKFNTKKNNLSKEKSSDVNANKTPETGENFYDIGLNKQKQLLTQLNLFKNHENEKKNTTKEENKPIKLQFSQINEVLPALPFSGSNCSILSAFYCLHSPEYKILYTLIPKIKKDTLIRAFEKITEGMIAKKPFLKAEYEKFKSLSEEEKLKVLKFHIQRLEHIINFPQKKDEGSSFEEFENELLGNLKSTNPCWTEQLVNARFCTNEDPKIGFGTARKQAEGRILSPSDTLICFGVNTGLESGELVSKYEVEEYNGMHIGDFFTNSKFITLSWGMTINSALPGEEKESPSFMLIDRSNRTDPKKFMSDVSLKLGEDFIDGALPELGYSSIEEEKIGSEEIKKYIDKEYLVNGELDVEKIYAKFLEDEEKYYGKKVKENIPSKIRGTISELKLKIGKFSDILEAKPENNAFSVAYQEIQKSISKFKKGYDIDRENIKEDTSIEKFFSLVLDKMLEAIKYVDVSDKTVFNDEKKTDLLIKKVVENTKGSLSRCDNPESIKGLINRILEKNFNLLRENLIDELEPKQKQKNKRYEDKHINYEVKEKINTLHLFYPEKDIKKDIKSGYLPISIMKNAIREKINKEKKTSLTDKDDKRLWEDDTILRLDPKDITDYDSLPFFGDGVFQKFRKNKDDIKFNSGYNGEKMYIAAICVHEGSAWGGGHWTCLQPKYKWDADKNEYVISKWVFLGCMGNGPKIWENDYAKEFLRNHLSNGNGIQGAKDTVLRVITKEEIEAFPEYYIMDEDGIMGKKENLRPDANICSLPKNWRNAIMEVVDAKEEDNLEEKIGETEEGEDKTGENENEKEKGNKNNEENNLFEINTSSEN